MEDRDLTELQDGAYKNMLEALATAEDPDAAQMNNLRLNEPPVRCE